jgi:hypothetical protein
MEENSTEKPTIDIPEDMDYTIQRPFKIPPLVHKNLNSAFNPRPALANSFAIPYWNGYFSAVFRETLDKGKLCIVTKNVSQKSGYDGMWNHWLNVWKNTVCSIVYVWGSEFSNKGYVVELTLFGLHYMYVLLEIQDIKPKEGRFKEYWRKRI